jgi:hypothetical protein
MSLIAAQQPRQLGDVEAVEAANGVDHLRS